MRVHLAEKNRLINIIFIITAVLFLFNFYYIDIIITYDNSFTLLNSLFGGFGLSKYSFESFFYVPIHFIFALWNFPSWLITSLSGVDPHAYLCLLWAKLLIVVFAAGVLYFLKKIIREIDKENSEFLTFVLMSSLLFFLPIMALGQYDVIELFFGLWAFYLASGEDKLSIKTCLILSCAVAVKGFFAIAALIIILLKEKRIRYIFRDCLILCIFPAFSAAVTVAFHAGSAVMKDLSASSDMAYSYLDKFVKGLNLGGNWNYSIFLTLVASAFALAYLSEDTASTEGFIKRAAWISAIGYLPFFLFARAHPFWSVLLMPFLILMLGNNKSALRKNMVVLSFFELSLFYMQVIEYCWVYLSENTLFLQRYNILPLIPTFFDTDIVSMELIYRYFGLNIFNEFITAIQLVSAGALVAINNPWKPMSTDKIRGSGIDINSDDNQFKREICIFRIVLLLLVFLMTFVITYLI